MAARRGEALGESHAIAVQQMFHPGLVASELLLHGFPQAHHSTGIDVITFVDIDPLKQARLERLYEFRRVHLVSLHRFLVLCGWDIGGVDYDAVNAYLTQRVVSGEPAEARFVNRMIFAIRIVLLQKVKERFRRRILGVAFHCSTSGAIATRHESLWTSFE